MNAKEFKRKSEKLISEIEKLIQQMPQKGNTQSECQKLTLQQTINEFSYAVNGVEDSDFIVDNDDD